MKNTTISKILVPVDFTETSDIALEQAIKMAVLLKAEVYLLHVIESDKYPYQALPESPASSSTITEFETATEQQLLLLRDKVVSKYGITPTLANASGHVYPAIIKASEENNIDLIVMGTHGASGLKELFIGSNSQRVVAHSNIPVLTMKQKIQADGFKNILIPIDDSLHSREKVNIAMLIAEAYNAHIHIIGLTGDNDDESKEKIRIKTESVENLVQEEELPFNTVLVPGGNMAVTAMKYADDQHCDLIVINTGHESDISDVFKGAFSQQLVNHSNVPVLSFRHSEHHYNIDTPGFGIA